MDTIKSSSYLSVSELAAVLDLQPNSRLFVNLLNRIRQISQQIFNPHETYDRQENEKVAELSAKMNQEFPDVLQDPALSSEVQRQRTKAVLFYCRQYYNSHRSILRAKERKAASPSLSTPPSTKGAKKTKTAKRTARGIVTPPPDSSRLSQRLRTSGPRPLSPTHSQSAARASGRGTRSEGVSSRTVSPVPSTSSPNALAQSPYSALFARYHARKPKACISDVAEFLGSCDPDMRYLLPSFMAFGCRNVEFLVNISCLQEGDIETVLKKITERHPPPEGVEEMDFVVVTKHFKEYFFGRSK